MDACQYGAVGIIALFRKL